MKVVTEGTADSVRARFPQAEWEARVELAACYRIFAMLGWTELIYNHITLRLPRPGQALPDQSVRPALLEVRASNLVKIDLAGNVIGDSDWPVNPAGFTVHAAIHDGIPGAHCVMHTHTTAGMAVACSARRTVDDQFLFGAAARQGRVPRLRRHHRARRRRAAAGAQHRRPPAVILRNHGLLAWADTVPRTFAILWTLNRACEIQLASMAMGPVIPIPEDIQRKCTRDSLQFSPGSAPARTCSTR